MMNHRQYLSQAIQLATAAGQSGNHPCGTIVVNADSEIIASSGNQVFTTPDITAHAEMLCLRHSGNSLMNKDRSHILYSSCEPCCGCAFYIARTNIKQVVYASKDRYRPGISMLKVDPKFEVYFKDIEILEEPIVDLRDEALNLMKNYFLQKSRPDTAQFFEIPS